jgi:hypothetical protein
MKPLVTGGAGFVGTAVVRHSKNNGTTTMPKGVNLISSDRPWPVVPRGCVENYHYSSVGFRDAVHTNVPARPLRLDRTQLSVSTSRTYDLQHKTDNSTRKRTPSCAA